VVAVLARRGDGNHRLTMRLDPGELGQIEVVIDRPPGAPATVTLTVERPETLLRLMRDQDQLARALGQAGLGPEDRGLHFRLAPQDPPQADPRPPAPTADTQAVTPTPLQGDTADSRPDGGRHPPHRSQPHADHARSSEPDTVPRTAATPPPRHLRQRGIDITA